MGQRGRKRIEIDWRTFESLCAIQATLTEMANFFHCSEDTIERAVRRNYGRHFAEVFAEKRQGGFLSLRRRMWELAIKGNVTLLIFMSKHFLAMGQPVPAPKSLTAIQAELQKQQLGRLSDEQLDEIERIIEGGAARELPPAATAQGEPPAAAPSNVHDPDQPGHAQAGDAVTPDPPPSSATSKPPGPTNSTQIIAPAPTNPGPATPAPDGPDDDPAKDAST